MVCTIAYPKRDVYSQSQLSELNFLKEKFEIVFYVDVAFNLSILVEMQILLHFVSFQG